MSAGLHNLRKYSIIIPVLNEEKILRSNLELVIKFKDQAEIIIVDGGSTDNSMQICRGFGLPVYKSSKGRGIQLNKGAELSKGEIILFLHADTKLPPDALKIIDDFFKIKERMIATFKLAFDADHLMLKVYSFFTRKNNRFTTFGDQVIVVRRSFFFEVGGFPSIPILEDFEFLGSARRLSRIFKLPGTVITSARRFQKKGIVKTQLITAFYLLKYYFGKKPAEIYADYYK